MEKRTKIVFDFNDPVWVIADNWAIENRYKIKESSSSWKLFQKGTGFLVAPMMLKIDRQGNCVSIEAWVRANLFVRAFSLFILPAEMEIKSGGLRGAAPRAIARKAVNNLLNALGQEKIK